MPCRQQRLFRGREAVAARQGSGPLLLSPGFLPMGSLLGLRPRDCRRGGGFLGVQQGLPAKCHSSSHDRLLSFSSPAVPNVLPGAENSGCLGDKRQDSVRRFSCEQKATHDRLP